MGQVGIGKHMMCQSGICVGTVDELGGHRQIHEGDTRSYIITEKADKNGDHARDNDHMMFSHLANLPAV